MFVRSEISYTNRLLGNQVHGKGRAPIDFMRWASRDRGWSDQLSSFRRYDPAGPRFVIAGKPLLQRSQLYLSDIRPQNFFICCQCISFTIPVVF